jgi:hypothetical protein
MSTGDSSQAGSLPRSVRLHHGTDLASAEDIRDHGLDEAAARDWNVMGEFWTTTDQDMANWYARVNPAEETPARLDFDLPYDVLLALLGEYPVVAYQDGTDVFVFLPGSYQALNRHMANKQVVSPVP